MLKQRVITGAIAGAGFLALLAWGGIAYTALIVLLAIIGYYEFVRMVGLKSFPVTALFGLAGTLLLAAPWSVFDMLHLPGRGATVIWLELFALLAVTVYTKNRISIDQAALLFLGVVYLGFGFHYMIETRLPEHGLYWSLFVFVSIWATDSGAYFVGSKLGKHPLWPAISPKKTVEGAIGGVAAAVVAAVIIALVSPERVAMAHAVWLGIVIGIVGQLGDLMQSAYKRVKGVKDTGAILPGHGGVLDRVDSWLIVFPFLHLAGALSVS